MFWNKKDDKKGLPDMAPLRSPFSKELSMQPAPEIKDEIDDDSLEEPEKHALPSFPDSPINRGFSQAAIKDAISNEEVAPEKIGEETTTEQKTFKTIEMEEPELLMPSSISQVKPSAPSEDALVSSTSRIMLPPMQSLQSQPATFQKPAQIQAPKNPNVFVKIDKFNTARRALQETQIQIENIDAILRKIRETKLREEQELVAWEKEISGVKSRIQEVTQNIFERAND